MLHLLCVLQTGQKQVALGEGFYCGFGDNPHWWNVLWIDTEMNFSALENLVMHGKFISRELEILILKILYEKKKEFQGQHTHQRTHQLPLNFSELLLANLQGWNIISISIKSQNSKQSSILHSTAAYKELGNGEMKRIHCFWCLLGLQKLYIFSLRKSINLVLVSNRLNIQ